MKKVVFIIAILVLVSCKNKTSNPVDYAIISGKIVNPETKKLFIYDTYEGKSIKWVVLDDKNTFRDTIYISSDRKFILFDENQKIKTNLHLSKGDEISINYDSEKHNSTLVTSGKGSESNNYFVSKEEKELEFKKDSLIYIKEEKDYKKFIARARDAKYQLLIETQGLSEEFKTNETASIKYEYLDDLDNYAGNHRYYTKKKDFKPSKKFTDEIKNIAYDNLDHYRHSDAYRGLVFYGHRKEARAVVEKDSTISIDIATLEAYGSNQNTTIKNELLYNFANSQIKRTEDIKTFYTSFLENSTDIKKNEKITELYNELKRLAKGSPSPKFTNYINHAGGKTSLDDLKGKYVLIDIWATWCGPCKDQIPFLKKLEKQYLNKNIEFVSITIDKERDYEKWRKMVVDMKLGGIQLFADKGFKSQFIKDYLINTIPQFILIDPSGNIVDANAPRPSNGELIDLFEELKI